MSEGKKEHSVKVPRLYKVAAGILRSYNNGDGGLKALVFDDAVRKKHPNVKAIHSLVFETVKRNKAINDICKAVQLFENEPRFDVNLAKILITELLWGKKGLAGASTPITTILKYEKPLRNAAESSDESADGDGSFKKSKRPRYARVNALKTTLTGAVRYLKSVGLTERFYDKANEDEFNEAVRSLHEGEFMLDRHVDNLVIFPPGTECYKEDMYKNGEIMLQDKASCLTIQALELEKGEKCRILDACAAPGMKTTQAAASISAGEESKVYAVERDSKRFNILNKIINDAGAGEAVMTINENFLDIVNDDFKESLDYIVLDPTCSGSGLIDRVEEDLDESRIANLASIQFKLLDHALTSFPTVKKVAYSTCSVHKEENEEVIRKAVKKHKANFKLVHILPEWKRRGLVGFKFGKKCVRVDPEADLCHGFFVAVFQRKTSKACDEDNQEES